MSDRTGINPSILDEIVADYIATRRKDARVEMDEFRGEQSRTAAIRRAARCEYPDGKRHPHQCLIPRRLLTLAEERLLAAAGRLAKARDFDALHDIVTEEIGAVHGIGKLMVYDIAHGCIFRERAKACLPAPGHKGRSCNFRIPRRNARPTQTSISVLAPLGR